ncbi:MAG: hypothetical protein ACOX8S_12850, partial [Christensenellales bacterium]
FADSKRLLAAWSAASRVIPLFQRTHWNSMDFQWYPEGCCFFRQTVEAPIFGSVNEFMQCPAMPGSGHLSVGEYCEAKHDGKTPSGITPLECAQEIYDNAAFAAKEAAELLSRENTGDPHLLATLNDILALSLLGRYYSLKLKAAVSLKDYMLQGGDECRREAVKLLEDAHCVWSEYAQFSLRLYKPQMLGGVDVIVQRWKEPVGDQIKVSAAVSGFNAPKTIDGLTERIYRMHRLVQAERENISVRGAFALVYECRQNHWLMPEGGFTKSEPSSAMAFGGDHPISGKQNESRLLRQPVAGTSGAAFRRRKAGVGACSRGIEAV